jgi:glyceraldehyde 3-phosphate dehydrogenase
MSVKIGINGFGRIGRSVFRVLAGRDRNDIQIAAINDLFENEKLAYLLKHDSVMGVFPGEVAVGDGFLTVDGHRIAMTKEREPAKIPWRDLGAEIVVESTGVFVKKEQLQKHLDGGAKKVILTVPASDEIDATIVMGVNDEILRPEHRLVSNASCTTNCLAPVAKILDERFGLEEGFMTTVHAYTNDQRLADAPHKDFRRSRAATQNVIPTTTGAARTVGKVLTHLKGKLDGMAMRVPVPDGSLVDLVARLREKPDAAAVNAAVREAAAGALAGIVEYSEVPLVSTDIVGNSHSSIFDALSTRATGDGYVKVVAWYDNEWGYSNRVVDLIGRMVAAG